MENYNDNEYNDLLYVNCYAKKNNMCNSISKLKNGMCDKCYKNINKNLTEKELFDNYISNRPEIINQIRRILNVCEQTVGKKNKATEVLHLFDLIYHNVYFTLTAVKFIKTFINKIIEIIKYNIDILNEVVDEKIKINEMYIDVLDFIITIHEHYKDIKINDMSDQQFLLEYNIFMKTLYDTICKKYNN